MASCSTVTADRIERMFDQEARQGVRSTTRCGCFVTRGTTYGAIQHRNVKQVAATATRKPDPRRTFTTECSNMLLSPNDERGKACPAL